MIFFQEDGKMIISEEDDGKNCFKKNGWKMMKIPMFQGKVFLILWKWRKNNQTGYTWKNWNMIMFQVMKKDKEKNDSKKRCKMIMFQENDEKW